jgi:hypothetical protein
MQGSSCQPSGLTSPSALRGGVSVASELPRPSPTVRAALEEAIAEYGDRIADTLVAVRETGSLDPTVLDTAAGLGNPNAARNYLQYLGAVLDAEMPSYPSLRSRVAGWVRRLRGRLGATLSEDTRNYLDSLIVGLELAAANPDEIAQEEREDASRSEAVAERVARGSGVYVYTYRHYERHPYLLLPDASGTPAMELHLMKIGYTDRGSERVFQQETSAPEPIQWLRFYEAQDGRPVPELEERFHTMLVRAGHPRSHPLGRGRPREWFATDILFLDELASFLGLRGAGETPTA